MMEMIDVLSLVLTSGILALLVDVEVKLSALKTKVELCKDCPRTGSGEVAA